MWSGRLTDVQVVAENRGCHQCMWWAVQPVWCRLRPYFDSCLRCWPVPYAVPLIFFFKPLRYGYGSCIMDAVKPSIRLRCTALVPWDEACQSVKGKEGRKFIYLSILSSYHKGSVIIDSWEHFKPRPNPDRLEAASKSKMKLGLLNQSKFNSFKKSEATVLKLLLHLLWIPLILHSNCVKTDAECINLPNAKLMQNI